MSDPFQGMNPPPVYMDRLEAMDYARHLKELEDARKAELEALSAQEETQREQVRGDTDLGGRSGEEHQPLPMGSKSPKSSKGAMPEEDTPLTAAEVRAFNRVFATAQEMRAFNRAMGYTQSKLEYSQGD